MSVRFHFLNVGSGDCTIVHFPVRTKGQREKAERIMIVDMNHHEDHEAYEHIANYYGKNFRDGNGNVQPIFRFVCSHPHHDHICGIKSFFESQHIKIYNFWDVPHSFEPENFDGHPIHEEDWKHYQLYCGSNSPVTVIRTKREDTPAQFWNDDEDRITILNPCDATIKHAHYKEDGTKRSKHEVEIDEVSYALSIKVNNRRIILAGDGRATPTWDDIFTNCKPHLVCCTILKAAHHGQESGFHEQAAKYMNPEYVVFSNSKEEDDAHGAERLYQKALPNAQILKTCDSGTIVMNVPFDALEPVTGVVMPR